MEDGEQVNISFDTLYQSLDVHTLLTNVDWSIYPCTKLKQAISQI